MTDAELRNLKEGDLLMGVIAGRLAVLETVKVIWSEPWPDGSYRRVHHVRARRFGKTRSGHRFPVSDHHRAAELQRLPKPDVVAVAFVADWLDENGYDNAAAHLRQAFPLSPEKMT